MNTAHLSLDQSPPLSVPGPYMATAPLFAAAAGLLLAFHPELLAHRWMNGTLALTHLITLGFLALVMMGAFQQLLAVLAGAPIPYPRLVGWTIYGSFTAGVIAITVGFTTGSPTALKSAMVLLGAGAALFIGVAGWCLFRRGITQGTFLAMGAALGGLLIAALLGLYLAGGHAGVVPLLHEVTPLHVAWGLIGWIGLLVMGVAYQVVPMFQITPDYPRIVTAWLAPTVVVALAAWSIGGWLWLEGRELLAIPSAVGLGLFAYATLSIQRRRRRRLPDITLDFWRLAAGALLLAVAVWIEGALTEHPLPEALLGVLFLMGFAVPAVTGMLYKIVPFLVWLHLNNRVALSQTSQGRIPHMKRVIPESRARLHFRLYLAGLILLAAAAATGAPGLARWAGAMEAVAAFLLAFNLWSALALYRRLYTRANDH